MSDPEDRFPVGDSHFPCDGDGCGYCAGVLLGFEAEVALNRGRYEWTPIDELAVWVLGRVS